MQDDISYQLESIIPLFPQLDNLTLIGTKGPQLIISALWNETASSVILRLIPCSDSSLFGWTSDFIDQVKQISRHPHPSLLKIYDAGIAGDYMFLISEQAPYPRMSDFEELPQIPIKNALILIQNITLGLRPLHQQGIYHGGITPKLISLASHGLDAKLLPVNIFPSQPPIDMKDFAAPEWVTGEVSSFTPGIDVYDLGLTLYVLLTRKTPLEADFAMPSTMINCSQSVDDLVAKAITPSTAERYGNLSDFLQDLETAIENPTPASPENSSTPAASPKKFTPPPAFNSSQAPITPGPGSSASLSSPRSKQSTSLSFYLLPALIIGLVFAFVSIKYKQDVTKLRNDYNQLVQQDNREKISQANASLRGIHEKNTPSSHIVPSVPSSLPSRLLSDSPTSVTRPQISPNLCNWCREKGVRVRQSSTRNDLSAYGPEKAIDGNTNSRLIHASIAVTDAPEDENEWLGVDFGSENTRSLTKIIIYTPNAIPQLGTMEQFKVTVYDNKKNVLAEKTFSTSENGKSSFVSEWNLDSKLEARAIRVEQLSSDSPLLITEIEAWGPKPPSAFGTAY